MMVKAGSAQERGLSAGMSEIAAAHGEEAAGASRRDKKARPDAGTEFRGVRRRRRNPASGKYGAQIWDRSRRSNVWLGTFGTAEDAAKAFDAAAVELRGAAATTNFKSPAAVRSSTSVTVVKEETGDGIEAVERRKKLSENVYKYYYKRRKDSRAGSNDGKAYQQLEALHCLAGAASPVATAVGVPRMVGTSAVRPLAEPPSVGSTAGMATPVDGGNLSFSTSNTEEFSDEEDMGERGKRKRTSEAAGAESGKMMRFFEGLMKQEMERQEAMQQRFLEAIEKREQDLMIREEAWRRQEMLAQERAMAATRNAAVLSFIQKITGQTISLPSMPPAPPSSQTHAIVTPSPSLHTHATATPPPSSQRPASTQPQPSPRPQNPPTMPPAASEPQKSQAPARLQPQQQQALVLHQSSMDIVMTPDETPHDSSSRWSKAEVHALIQLRCNLTMHRKGLWEEVSAGMRRMGYSRSSKRCRDKWWNMDYYFKKVKESNKKRPEDSKTCHYFHQLEAFYRNKAALGSPAGAGGAATEHAKEAPLDRIEAFGVGVPVAVIRRTAAARSDSRSGYRGVCLYGERYFAQIKEPGRPARSRKRLGTFCSVEEAATAYDAAALRLYGASAKTNFEQPQTGADADDLPEVRPGTISAPPAEWQLVEEFLKKMNLTDVVA